MKLVQPIRDNRVIADIKEYLKEKSERNYILFLTGIYTGFRISDMLRLRVRDVKGWSIYLVEGKTKKSREVHMPPELKRAMREYIKNKPDPEFLFRSREGKNKPITRGMAYKILQDVAVEFGLDRIGNHSLRKTYGFHHYNQYKDVVSLQESFNHSDPEITLRYIGVKQDRQDYYQKKLVIG